MTLLAFACTLKEKCETELIKSNGLSVTSFWLITAASKAAVNATHFDARDFLFLKSNYGMEYFSWCGLGHHCR